MEVLDPVLNFAEVEVSTGYDASATSIVLETGEGAKLPAPATDGEFNLVWWNFTDYPNPSLDPNVEIVRVTARSTDTLTVERNQESSGASTKNTADKTYKMALAMTKKTLDEIDEAVATGWIPSLYSWVYASATTITIAGVDLTSIFTKGAKIRLDNDGSTKYFYVLSSTFSTNTTVTLVGESDLANSAITNPYYSYADCPQGFKKGEDWYQCSVYADTAQAVVSNTPEALELNQENYDPNSNFNTGTYLYTAPVTGKYLVCGQSKVAMIGNTERWVTRIMVAGGIRHSGVDVVANGTTYLASAVSAVILVNKGQTVGINIMCAGGSRSTQDDGDNRSNYMTVQFVGI